METEPTDEQLIAFAAETLGRLADMLVAADLLRETVTENRPLWLELYRLSHPSAPDGSGA